MGGIGGDMAGHPAIYQENQAVPDGKVARCSENYIPGWLLLDWQRLFSYGMAGAPFSTGEQTDPDGGISVHRGRLFVRNLGAAGSGRKLERDGQGERRPRVDRKGTLSLREASHLHRNRGRLHWNGFGDWRMAMHPGFSRHPSRSDLENRTGRAPHDGGLSPCLSSIPAPGKGADPWITLKRCEVTEFK